MYIERDSRRQTPRTPKTKPVEAQEYLGQCLELLISGIVQRLPRVMGQSDIQLFLLYFFIYSAEASPYLSYL